MAIQFHFCLFSKYLCYQPFVVFLFLISPEITATRDLSVNVTFHCVQTCWCSECCQEPHTACNCSSELWKCKSLQVLFQSMTRILGALAPVQGMFHDTSDLLLLSLRIPNLVPDLSLSINFYLLHSSAQFIQQTQHSVPTPWKEQSVATRWHSVNNRWSQWHFAFISGSFTKLWKHYTSWL